MENQKKLIHWFLNNKGDFSAAVSKFDWVSFFDSNLQDFGVMSDAGLNPICGRGSDRSRGAALTKAIMEFLERRLIICNSILHSNGVAGHFTKVDASSAALNEIIERQVFFLCWLIPISFKKVNDIQLKNLGFSFEVEKRKLIEDFKVNLAFYYLGTLEARHVFGVAMDGLKRTPPFGAVFGLGCSKNPTIAIEKAFIESLRHVSFVLFQNENNLNKFTPRLHRDKWSIFDQKLILLNADWYSEFVFPTLGDFDWNGNWFDLSQFHSRQFKFKNLDSNSLRVRSDLELFFIKAEEPSYIPFWVGPPPEGLYDLKIIKRLQSEFNSCRFRQTLPPLMA